VFQTVQHTLGLSADIWRMLDKAHSARNLADYGGQLEISEQLYKDLLAATRILHDAVLNLGPVDQKAE
jgi:hypothetical protein